VALQRLTQLYGADAKNICAALGPSIGPCCFEVGEEVAAQFSPEAVRRGPGKPKVDLRAAIASALIGAGLSPEKIDARPPCTHCDPGRFFSYRRDGRETGQHIAFITQRS
jgi:hypothetical protein